MENEKVKMEENTNKKIVMIVVGVVIVLAVVVFFLLFFGKKKDNKQELESSLTEMGREFYENFYYEQIGSTADERTSLLSKFTTVGIKVDLDNLGRYNNGEYKEKINDFMNKKTKEKCNKTNTKVVIYPKSPYGKTDYSVETELDCGFEKENKK